MSKWMKRKNSQTKKNKVINASNVPSSEVNLSQIPEFCCVLQPCCVYGWSWPLNMGAGSDHLLLEFSLSPLIKKIWQPYQPDFILCVCVLKHSSGKSNLAAYDLFSHCCFRLFHATGPTFPRCVHSLGSWWVTKGTCLVWSNVCVLLSLYSHSHDNPPPILELYKDFY